MAFVIGHFGTKLLYTTIKVDVEALLSSGPSVWCKALIHLGRPTSASGCMSFSLRLRARGGAPDKMLEAHLGRVSLDGTSMCVQQQPKLFTNPLNCQLWLHGLIRQGPSNLHYPPSVLLPSWQGTQEPSGSRRLQRVAQALA